MEPEYKEAIFCWHSALAHLTSGHAYAETKTKDIVGIWKDLWILTLKLVMLQVVVNKPSYIAEVT